MTSFLNQSLTVSLYVDFDLHFRGVLEFRLLELFSNDHGVSHIISQQQEKCNKYKTQRKISLSCFAQDVVTLCIDTDIRRGDVIIFSMTTRTVVISRILLVNISFFSIKIKPKNDWILQERTFI